MVPSLSIASNQSTSSGVSANLLEGGGILYGFLNILTSNEGKRNYVNWTRIKVENTLFLFCKHSILFLSNGIKIQKLIIPKQDPSKHWTPDSNGSGHANPALARISSLPIKIEFMWTNMEVSLHRTAKRKPTLQ